VSVATSLNRAQRLTAGGGAWARKFLAVGGWEELLADVERSDGRSPALAADAVAAF